ncbi:MAG TPA: radical SAM protein [Oscillatoriaceae cyanobacterium]
MKLVLVNPPEMQGFVSDRDKAGGIGVAKPRLNTWRTPYLPPTPPMDLLYAAAIAEKAAVPLKLVDAIGRRLDGEATLRAVAAESPSHIGVRLSMPSLEEDLAFADRMKAQHPGAKVFLFGHATQTTHSHWLARSQADAVFFGEVEALLMPYLNGETLPHHLVPGTPMAAANWAYVEELDGVPFPAWHHIDIAHYSPSGRVEDFVFYLLTSRGCPKGCSMCPYYVHQGKQWRFRSIDNIMAELDYLRGLGARYIQTRDPNISWRKPHLLAIAERLKGEKQFRISTETDLEVLNEADLLALREAGFVRIMTGVESVDEAVIKDIGQNQVALKRVLDNMTLCEKLGIQVTGFFIVGSLNETWRSVRSTIATAKALPCTYSVSLMTPYFGTKMRDQFVERGYYQEASFKRYNGYSGLVRTVGLDFPEVVLAHAWAQAEVELVTRERQLKSLSGAQRLKQSARVALQRARVLRLRAQVAQCEARTPAPAPAAT